MRLGCIREKCPDAIIWLEDIGRDSNDVDRNNRPRYNLWALSFDEGGHRLNIMTINGLESLNNVFKEARELPITSLVEITFYKSVKYFAERMTNAETMIQQGFFFSPKIQALLEERRLSENTHTVRVYRNERKYEAQTDQRFIGNRIKENRIHTVRMEVPGVHALIKNRN
jgi:hypothetical protein